MAVRGSPGFVRVRFNQQGEAELSAEDLRKSGQEDLARLAEADRKESSTMFVRGDDDGWLTPTEVDKCSGMHVSVQGGYQAILKAVEKKRVEVIPVSDLARLMKLGASGPIKYRVPPKLEQPPPKDLILDPPKYDSKKASPSFLKEVEAAIEGAISKKSELVYRGFALPDYGGPELVRYLMGDWRCVIASHTFSETLRANLSKGRELHDAIERTANKIGAQILREVMSDGYDAYATAQSRATQIGIADKKATGMATYRESPLAGPMMTPTSFGYAHTGFLGLIADRTLEATHPMIMLEVEQKVPDKYEHAEYYIPSHVPPTKVPRFFLGFSTWHDARDFLRPPEEKTRWYEVAILKRDADGKPTEMSVTPVQVKHAGLMESVTYGDERWSSKDAGSKAGRAFAEKHALIAPTLEEIARQLLKQG